MSTRLRATERGVTDATRLIVELATLQHGVVARRQLVGSGLGSGLIDGRIANGRLVPVFAGVYGLGTSRLDRPGRWMAASLRAGPDAALSHRSAGALHGLIAPGSGAIELVRPASEISRLVSNPARGVRSFSALVHSARALPEVDLAVVDGIPVTSVARTLLDLSAVLSLKRVKSALVEAERKRTVSRGELMEVIGRGRGWNGVVRLRQALEEFDPTEAETRSELEIEMLRLCRTRGIPAPAVNVAISRFVVDFFWPSAGLVVEVDGFEFHGRRSSFQSDRNRDVDLQLAGLRVARFTYEDVIEAPGLTAQKLRQLLKLGATRGSVPG